MQAKQLSTDIPGYFRLMDEKLTDAEFVGLHLSEVNGWWTMDWSGTEFESGVRLLFSVAAIQTPFTGLCSKPQVVAYLRGEAMRRLGRVE